MTEQRTAQNLRIEIAFMWANGQWKRWKTSEFNSIMSFLFAFLDNSILLTNLFFVNWKYLIGVFSHSMDKLIKKLKISVYLFNFFFNYL